MPTRDTAPQGAPCWIQLTTSDVAGARSFYADLFGWEAGEPSAEFGGYFMFLRDGVPVAGGMAQEPGAAEPDNWSVYLNSDDAAKAVEVAAGAGGQVVVPPMPIADLGTMAFLLDPSGAGVGVWQPDTFPGFTVLAEPGAPSWFELHTSRYEACLDFYREVFRWETSVMSDTAEFRYTTQREPGTADGMLAGVMDAAGAPGLLPDGVGGVWTVYFGVADTDAALARVGELGGSVVAPAEDTPYGRLAAAADPTGTLFRLVAANDQMPARS